MFLVAAALLALAAAALLFLLVHDNLDVVRAEVEPLGAGQVEPFTGQAQLFDMVGKD